jgi:hypothetical protein
MYRIVWAGRGVLILCYCRLSLSSFVTISWPFWLLWLFLTFAKGKFLFSCPVKVVLPWDIWGIPPLKQLTPPHTLLLSHFTHLTLHLPTPCFSHTLHTSPYTSPHLTSLTLYTPHLTPLTSYTYLTLHSPHTSRILHLSHLTPPTPYTSHTLSLASYTSLIVHPSHLTPLAAYTSQHLTPFITYIPLSHLTPLTPYTSHTLHLS